MYAWCIKKGNLISSPFRNLTKGVKQRESLSPTLLKSFYNDISECFTRRDVITSVLPIFFKCCGTHKYVQDYSTRRGRYLCLADSPHNMHDKHYIYFITYINILNSKEKNPHNSIITLLNYYRIEYNHTLGINYQVIYYLHITKCLQSMIFISNKWVIEFDAQHASAWVTGNCHVSFNITFWQAGPITFLLGQHFFSIWIGELRNN